jgi:hypothetical protein
LMLWLRPTNPAIKDWDNLIADCGIKSGVLALDRKLAMNWIEQADKIPDILEILRYLSTVQTTDDQISCVWRRELSEDVENICFVEALRTFDRLMGPNCTPSDHLMLIDLVCRELQAKPAPNFKDYFTSIRVDSLSQLKDHCLQALACCAREIEFVTPFCVSEDYNGQQTASLNRIQEYLLAQYPVTDVATVLEAQAFLWPVFSGALDRYRKARERPDVFVSS